MRYLDEGSASVHNEKLIESSLGVHNCMQVET